MLKRLHVGRSVILLAAASLAAACTVGEVYQPGAGKGDDTGGGDGGGEVDGPDSGLPVVDCDPAVTQGLNSGQHNAGLSCIAAGCHDGNTADAPLWTLAGTVYDAVGGVTPVPGATITVIDAANVETKLVTAQNGNFYSAKTFSFPLRVTGSKCPSSIDMIGEVAANGGSCNAGGCHDAANRIHVP